MFQPTQNGEFSFHRLPWLRYLRLRRLVFIQVEVQREVSDMPADKAPVVPIGMTTVLTGDELNRIRTTLLHAEAKTQGQTIMSEVCTFLSARIRPKVTTQNTCDPYQ